MKRLILLFCVALCFGCRGESESPPGAGPAAAPDPADLAEKIESLQSLGYLGGTEAPTDRRGVTVHLPERTSPGLNLVISAHAHAASLMDAAGRTLHTWRKDASEAFPGQEPLATHFRRAQVLPNGDLVVVYARADGLVKLDPCSEILWATYNGAHHDLEVQPDGDIVTLLRKAHVVPRLHPEEPVLEDYVAVIDAAGEERRRVSLLEAWLRSDLQELWPESKPRHGDIFHTNSVHVLRDVPPGVPEAFRPGRVLVSIRSFEVIALLDMDLAEVVWAMDGSFRQQHDAQLLPAGHLLLFDNQGRGGHSRILEYDLETGDLAWEYPGERGASFHSQTRGQVQRLANGNTLITETDAGRAFEVDPAGDVVWEYVNPERTVDDGEERIAPLLDVRRLPPDLPTDWIAGCPARASSSQAGSAVSASGSISTR